MSTDEPFYLDGLLVCECSAGMRGGLWRQGRRYRCDRCGNVVDALGVEVEVWEVVTQERPELGSGRTAYLNRGPILSRVVEAVQMLNSGRFHPRWRRTDEGN